MSALQTDSQEYFADKLAAHLRRSYGECLVRLSGAAMPVARLTEDAMQQVVDSAIKRAQSRGFRTQSSIASFCALMIDVAPNFDRHELVQGFFSERGRQAGNTISRILSTLSEAEWQQIRAGYDERSWDINA